MFAQKNRRRILYRNKNQPTPHPSNPRSSTLDPQQIRLSSQLVARGSQLDKNTFPATPRKKGGVPHTRQSPTKFIVAAVLIVGVVTWIAFSAASQSKSYYVTI